MGVLGSADEFLDPSVKKLNKLLTDFDKASREGLRFASTLMLFADVLNRAFEQAQTQGISRRDTGSIIQMIGPTSRLLFDQFARISVWSTQERRNIILDSVQWPSTEARLGLPSFQ